VHSTAALAMRSALLGSMSVHGVSLLDELDDAQIRQLVDHTIIESYPPESAVVAEAEMDDCIRIILAGQATLSARLEKTSTTLQVGDTIGDGAFARKRMPRKTTVMASSDVPLITLSLDVTAAKAFPGLEAWHARLVTLNAQQPTAAKSGPSSAKVAATKGGRRASSAAPSETIKPLEEVGLLKRSRHARESRESISSLGSDPGDATEAKAPAEAKAVACKGSKAERDNFVKKEPLVKPAPSFPVPGSRSPVSVASSQGPRGSPTTILPLPLRNGSSAGSQPGSQTSSRTASPSARRSNPSSRAASPRSARNSRTASPGSARHSPTSMLPSSHSHAEGSRRPQSTNGLRSANGWTERSTDLTASDKVCRPPALSRAKVQAAVRC